MAAATDVVLADGQGTPANHTFSPARKNGPMVEWEERVTNHLPNGFYTLAISTTSTKSKSPVVRGKVSVSVPLENLNADTGNYEYSSVNRFSIDILIAKDSTQAERNDLAAYLKNLCAHTVIQNFVKNLDSPF